MNAETLAIGDTELRIPWAALRILALLAGLLACAVIGGQVAPYVDGPVKSIRVDGDLAHLTPQQIAAVAGVAPGVRLFAVDLAGVRDRVEALPWVGHARVSRLWPDGIAIRVEERVPVARWGAEGLLDSEVRTFMPPTLSPPSGLPWLDGPADRVADVWNAYGKLAAALADGPFALAGLNLDARGDWTAETRRGITLQLGQDDPADKLPLIVGAVAHSLSERLGQVAYIDLRYPNGFAVGWANGNATLRCAADPAAASASLSGATRQSCRRRDVSATGVTR